MVTELRRGLRSPSDRRKVLPLLEACRILDQPARLWEEAGEIGYLLARRGRTVKSLDLLIATYALTHAVPILAVDADFAVMRRAGLQLLLVEP